MTPPRSHVFPMVRRCLFACLAFLSVTTHAVTTSQPPATAPAPETVVLLHGLGLGGWAMHRLATALTRDGYRVVNLSYPSRSVPLETLARDWLPAQLATHRTADAPRLHFVTHSMGGILVRTWLAEQRRAGAPAPANLGRVVMIAPPNQGSAVAQKLENFPPFRWFTDVNGRRLGTTPDSLPLTLGPWPFPSSTPLRDSTAGQLGVIAGDVSLNPLFSAWLGGPDDGKVTVASTHLAGETAHRVLSHSHTWLQWRADTHRAVSTFLRTGRFN